MYQLKVSKDNAIHYGSVTVMPGYFVGLPTGGVPYEYA